MKPPPVAPHDLDAERALLGALLVWPELLHRIPASLTSRSFFRQAHGLVFVAVVSVAERHEGVDLLTVRAELERMGVLEDVGGAAYLARMTDAMPMKPHVETYADLVSGHATRRALIAAAQRIEQEAYAGALLPNELLDRATRAMNGVSSTRVSGGPVSVADLVPETMRLMESAHDGHALVTGVATGYEKLDEMTCGLQGGDLILLAARPSMGKTSLGLNIAERAAERGVYTVVCSLEMSRQQLMFRLACGRARVSGFQLRSGFLSPAKLARIGEVQQELLRLPMAIDDTPALAVGDFRSIARREVEERQAGLFVIDYLQLMKSRERHESRNQEVAHISSTLKQVARELNVPVLALSQLNRSPDDRKDKRPTIADLRESGSLEQDADVVLLLWHDKGDDAPTEVIVGKQRNGPTGTVKLSFIKDQTRFESYAPGGPPGGDDD